MLFKLEMPLHGKRIEHKSCIRAYKGVVKLGFNNYYST